MTCYLHPAVEKGEQKQKLNILESTSRRLVFNIPNTLQVTDFGQIKKNNNNAGHSHLFALDKRRLQTMFGP